MSLRSFNKKNEWDLEELKKLNAEDWQIKCLLKNPNYVYWGNYEDYMTDKNSQWGSPQEIESVDDLWELNDLNEVVHFYFFIERENHTCPDCNGEGLNKETCEINRSFYDFEMKGNRWCEKITQDEVDALWEAGRLTSTFKDKPTAEEVNKKAKEGVFHDAINRWILVKARAKRLGVYGDCENKDCVDGYIYDKEKATLSLQMWILHPRKGASRGVILKDIKEHEVEKVIAYLKEARDRNNERFSRL